MMEGDQHVKGRACGRAQHILRGMLLFYILERKGAAAAAGYWLLAADCWLSGKVGAFDTR